MAWLIFLVVAILSSISIARNLVKRNREIKLATAHQTDWERQRHQEQMSWKMKVGDALIFLSGKDWRDPDGKTEFIRQIFGEEAPQYLWYEVEGQLSQTDIDMICQIFWGCKPDFGDLERHKCLRVRNAKHFAPEIVLQDGRHLPLHHVGYAYAWTTKDDPGIIMFEDIYQEAATI